jgi:hypothetical protein
VLEAVDRGKWSTLAQTLVYTVAAGAFSGQGNDPVYIHVHHALTFWRFHSSTAAFTLPMKEGLSPEDSLGRTHLSERKNHDPTLTTHGLSGLDGFGLTGGCSNPLLMPRTRRYTFETTRKPRYSGSFLSMTATSTTRFFRDSSKLVPTRLVIEVCAMECAT